MSVKSFLSKLKQNSKIAKGDDNMFIELKPATLFTDGIYAKAMICSQAHAIESPLSLTRTL